jgi:sugar phosphate isomerase/epimerase
MDRRSFLSTTAALLAAPGVAFAQARQPLAVQFFTFSAFCGKGWDKFSQGMAAAKAIGYDGVEFAGLWGNSPAQVRRRADELGLTLRSYHLGNDIVRAFQAPGGSIADAQDATYTPIGVVQVCRATLGIARDLGCEYAGLGAVGRSNFASPDAVRRMAEAFDTCAELARQAGLKFFYHNHALDFVPVGGRVPFDVFVAETSPQVLFQFDTGWAGTERIDVVQVLEKHAARIRLLHLRDATAQGQTTVVGQGVVDFASVVAAARRLDDPVLIMEGNSKPEAEAVADARSAYQHLRRFGLGMATA